MQQKIEWTLRLNPMFGGLNCDDVLIMFVELDLEQI
jgi:hypothetical protein